MPAEADWHRKTGHPPELMLASVVPLGGEMGVMEEQSIACAVERPGGLVELDD